jgi:YfiH family protein
MNNGNSDYQNQSLIRYPGLSQFEGLSHFTTTKQSFSSGNPRFTRIPESERVQNISQLSELTGIENHRFVFPMQTHSSNIKIVDSLDGNNFQDTDALITSQQGICICVQTADCVPVFLYVPIKNVVAIIHAGWRGTVNQIVLKTVRLMEEVFDINPEKLLAIIGPSVGPGVYEVGEDVISEVIKNIPSPYKSFTPVSNNKALLNLWVANHNLLVEAGLKSENIDIPGYCTFSESDRFYSARREGKHTGRQVSGIMLK